MNYVFLFFHYVMRNIYGIGPMKNVEYLLERCAFKEGEVS